MPARRPAVRRGLLPTLAGLMLALVGSAPADAAFTPAPLPCDQVRQIIHRGNGGDDNTVEQVTWAARHGAGVEVDLRRTSDGAIVLMHDDDLFAITTSHGSLARTTLAQVRRLRTKHDQRVATLADFVAAMRQTPAERLQLELKVPFTPAQVAALVTVLDRAGFQGHVMLTSTLVGNLRSVYRADPRIPTGWITYDPFVPDLSTAHAAHVDWAMIGQNSLYAWPHYLRDAAALGIRVQGRLVNVETAAASGIQRVTLDDPSACAVPASTSTEPEPVPVTVPDAPPAPQPTGGPIPPAAGGAAVGQPVALPSVETP